MANSPPSSPPPVPPSQPPPPRPGDQVEARTHGGFVEAEGEAPVAVEDQSFDHENQRWGLGEVWLGLLAGMIFTLFAAALAVAVGGYDSTLDDAPMAVFALVAVALHAGLLLVVWVAGMKGFGWIRDFRVSMKLNDIPLGLGAGILSQFAIGLVYIPLLKVLGKDLDEVGEPARELSERASDVLGDASLIIMVGLVAPIVEEIFFRGLMFRALDKRFDTNRYGRAIAVVGSSVLFAAYHFQLLQFLALLMIGLVLAALTHHYKRLGPAIWAHIGFNMTTVINLLYL